MLSAFGADFNMLKFLFLAKFLHICLIDKSLLFCIGFVAHDDEVDVWECIFLDLCSDVGTYPSQKLSISSKLSFLVMS